MLLKAVDLVGKAIGKNFGLEEKFFTSIASLVFDPKEVAEKGKQTAEEEKKILTELKNQRDGYANQINAIDKKAGDERKARAKEIANELVRIEKEKNEKLLKEADDFFKNAKAAEEQRIKDDAENLARQVDELNKIQTPEDQEQKEATKRLLEIDNFKGALSEKKALLDDYNSFVMGLEYQTDQQKAQLEEEGLRRKKIIRDQELALVGQTFGKVAELLGKNSKVGKAFAISQALINTYQGITAELATKAVTPYEIGLKVANIAFVASTGFKAVKSIIGTKENGGGGSPSIGGGAGSPQAQAPSFNVVGNAGVNQIAQTLGEKQPPVQAYVVANNVTTAQSANRNIIENASLG